MTKVPLFCSGGNIPRVRNHFPRIDRLPSLHPYFHLSVELGLRHFKVSEIQGKAGLIPEVSLSKNRQTVSLRQIRRLFPLLMGTPSIPTRRKELLPNFPPISPAPSKTPCPPHPHPPKTRKGVIAHLIGHSLKPGPLIAGGPGRHMLNSSCPCAEALLLFQFLCQRSAGQGKIHHVHRPP